ncbi:PilT protein domain-containing protein [Candidatus Magnetobacterium bavaricum]|uniref:PilT protein domain-containing protein n=1 Tax=Candidatus Magnetobacterium bavaricum TaxID=29290 RepID=A0A0F3H239_9BACT|nr:PilT protein domain-containing protein [Candidatus Magnetobacterium bavaricum]
MKKIVIDTNVFVSSFFNPKGIPRKIVDLWKNGEVILCVSEEIIGEYVRVLNRFDFIGNNNIKELLRLFNRRQYLIIVRPLDNIYAVINDHSDNKFIECALSAKAAYIVSGDKHLKDLRSYEAIRILSPSEFYNLIITEE